MNARRQELLTAVLEDVEQVVDTIADVVTPEGVLTTVEIARESGVSIGACRLVLEELEARHFAERDELGRWRLA